MMLYPRVQHQSNFLFAHGQQAPFAHRVPRARPFAARHQLGIGFMTRVLIADDHGLIRAGLKATLEREPGITVCAEASDGQEALELIESTKPDLAILDVTMPRLGGFEALERIRESHPRLKVILLSIHGDAPFVQSALALGAKGYILKTGSITDVNSGVKAVAAGETYFSPAISREVVAQLYAPASDEKNPLVALSNREREVLHMIAEGSSAKEIANSLRISTKTVEAHRTSLMRKLKVRKATELVRYALRHGLIEL